MGMTLVTDRLYLTTPFQPHSQDPHRAGAWEWIPGQRDTCLTGHPCCWYDSEGVSRWPAAPVHETLREERERESNLTTYSCLVKTTSHKKWITSTAGFVANRLLQAICILYAPYVQSRLTMCAIRCNNLSPGRACWRLLLTQTQTCRSWALSL